MSEKKNDVNATSNINGDTEDAKTSHHNQELLNGYSETANGQVRQRVKNDFASFLDVNEEGEVMSLSDLSSSFQSVIQLQKKPK